MFPHEIESETNVGNKTVKRKVTLYGPFTVILGPNGAGKTQLMRGMRQNIKNFLQMKKKVRFLSAGRIGNLEEYRSNSEGISEPSYQSDRYGDLEDSKRRHEYETLKGDFQTLAVRPDILLKVRERLRKLFGRDLEIVWSAGSIKVYFSGIKSAKSYNASREASGLLHLAGLLSAIYDDDIGAILLDEPEVSLHPQLQAFLLRELAGVAGLPEQGSCPSSEHLALMAA
jgi:AAA15 family ATPase/GTPase